MRSPSTRADDPSDALRLNSGAALFTFDASHRVRSWNKAAERLTGFAAEEMLGRPCWEALCGRDVDGGLVCHPGCSYHRLLRERWPVSPSVLVIKTATGSRRVQVAVIAIEDRTLSAALMLEPSPEPSSEGDRVECGPEPELTPRQLAVLRMLADGMQARAIAGELRLSEFTIRNHIRAVLRELRCTSQLAAVARARRLGLV